MNLQLTEEQQLLQKSVREFAEAEVKPLAKENDETGKFPRALIQKAAELGLTGVAIPENEGGSGMDHISYSIVIEEIARVCASTAVILSVQNSLYCDPDPPLRHRRAKERNSCIRSRAAKKSAATRSPSHKPARTPPR